MYTDFILKNMPRVLSQIDRDEHSTTYGSCDRNHWHLKIRDFSSAILQQSGLALAIAYETDFEGNIYYKNENLRKWSIATVYYWAKIQLRDGSYNEYYPWEHGFPPTAFSLYSACEIYKRFDLQDEYILKKIQKTSNYLVNHIEPKAFNQEIASITALYSAYTITKEEWILEGVNKKLSRVLSLQSEEGWFPEYGGADLGYLSVAFDMLSEYYWMSKDEQVKEPLLKVLDFIQYFIHPDATVGGEYGSRNTTYFLPNGLQIMSIEGEGIAERAIEVLYGDTLGFNYFMDSTDDRYFSHYLMHSFLRALEKRQAHKSATAKELPFEYNHERFFTEAGLLSFKNEEYTAFISMKKGGVIKMFVGKEERYMDCGYRVNHGKGCVSVTNWIDDSYKVSNKDDTFEVAGNMNKIKLKVSTPILLMGLRVVAFVMGNKIITFLKKKIILVDKHSDICFNRKIALKEDCIEISDQVFAPHTFKLERASNMSARHVASGKFFMTSDLLCKTGLVQEEKNSYKMNYVLSK